jgi:RNA polymerase sigma factor (sigma-70 family)
VARDHHRDRRDITREQTQSAAADDDRACPGWALELIDASAPSPAEAAVLSEAMERRLASLADPELRQIALWRIEGFTNREIADQLDCTERSIERKLERLRSKWSSYADGSS